MKESKFNAKGSDKLNWFSLSRLSQSSWFDLRSQPKNYFSIAGEPTHGRRFFINRNYGGCQADNGWMMVVTGHICSWEKRFLPTKNVILYSKKPVYTNWNTYSEQKIQANKQTTPVTFFAHVMQGHWKWVLKAKGGDSGPKAKRSNRFYFFPTIQMKIMLSCIHTFVIARLGSCCYLIKYPMLQVHFLGAASFTYFLELWQSPLILGSRLESMFNEYGIR